MQATLPHEIIYDTPGLVPIGDIIESLRGAVQLAEEIGPLLELMVPGLEIESISIRVREITQASPLREAFAFGLVGLYQENLGRDMPKIVHDLFGVDLPPEYNNLVSLVFIVLVFYAGQFVYDQGGKLIERRTIRRQYDGLVKEIAEKLGASEDSIKKLLDDRFGKVKIGALIDAAGRVLQPSKNQGNARVIINARELPQELIADFPSRAQVLSEEPESTTDPLENVEIFIHAQDVDHNKQGWAAIVPMLSPKRLRMHIYPAIKPADIYTKTKIRGDIVVESMRNSVGVKEPVRIHLTKVRDEPKGLPTPAP